MEQLKMAQREQAKKAAGANMARKTGKSATATAVDSHPACQGSGLPGDPEFELE